MSEHHDAHDTKHHISPVSQYWGIWIGLMILTVITVLAYYIPVWYELKLGSANIIIAMAIATTKASLVCLYFMHLKFDKKFHMIAFLSSLIFLGLFLTFTLLDINTRDDSQPFAKPLYAGKTIVKTEHGGGHSEEKKEGATTGEARKEESKEGAASHEAETKAEPKKEEVKH